MFLKLFLFANLSSLALFLKDNSVFWLLSLILLIIYAKWRDILLFSDCGNGCVMMVNVLICHKFSAS